MKTRDRAGAILILLLGQRNLDALRPLPNANPNEASACRGVTQCSSASFSSLAGLRTLHEITILAPWRSSPKTWLLPARLERHALDSSANTRTTSQDPDPGPLDLHFSELHAFVRGVVGPVEDQVVVSAGSSEDHAMATVAGPQGLVVLNPGPRDGSIF